MTDTTPHAADVRRHRHPRRWPVLLCVAAAYVAAGLIAHFAAPEYLSDLTLLSYAVAEVGGAAFIVRYLRTNWRSHPWGRHVMAFMVCMEIIFTLTLSRRLFGVWFGLPEALFLASVTFAGIVWWRYWLLSGGTKFGSQSPSTAHSSASLDVPSD